MTVVEAHTSHLTTRPVLVAFRVLATAGLLAAELYVGARTGVRPAPSADCAPGWRGHSPQTVVLGSAAIGLWLTGKSVYELAG